MAISKINSVIISNLPIYTEEQFSLVCEDYEMLINFGSADEWYEEAFTKVFSYWDEINSIKDFDLILEAILNEDGKILSLLINTKEKNSPLIRCIVNLDLTIKYNTLIFEKINMVMTLYEEYYLWPSNEEEIMEFPDGVAEFYEKMNNEFYYKLI